MADNISRYTPYIGVAQNFLGKALGFSQEPKLNTANSSISTFNAMLNKRGVSRASRFFVRMGVPTVLQNNSTSNPNIQRELMLLCESSSLPGVSFATSDGRRYGVGPVDRRPFAPIFNDITMNFLCDGTNLVHRYFYTWMNSIVRFDNNAFGASADATSRLNSFRVEYKENYATDISIITYNETNDEITKITLNKAFPVAVGEVPLNWAETNSINRLPISFHYWNWKMERVSIDSLSMEKIRPELNILERIYKTKDAIFALKSIKKPQHVGDVINIINNSRIILENF